jgi:hypothetical protein
MQDEFEFPGLEKRNDIILTSAGSRELRPAQAAFNKAVKRLRKVKETLEVRKAAIGKQREKFEKQVLPAFTEYNAAMLDWVLAALDWYENPDNGLGAQKSETLLEFILATADDIQNNQIGLDTETLEKLEERLSAVLGEDDDGDEEDEGEPYGDDDPEAQMKKALLGMMEEMLRDEGLDIDLSDVDPDDFDTLNARAEEAMRNAGFAKKPRKRTAKQIAAAEERERKAREKEQLKLRDFKSLFKSLAKSMHPDLVTDPEAKAHREDWMKRLTAAYENHDLHSMLAIEMEWLGSESKDLEAASDEKLAMYTELLREQTREVEREIHFLRFEDPMARISHAAVPLPSSPGELAARMREDAETTRRETEELKAGGKAARAQVTRLLKRRHHFPPF